MAFYDISRCIQRCPRQKKIKKQKYSQAHFVKQNIFLQVIWKIFSENNFFFNFLNLLVKSHIEQLKITLFKL